MYSPVAVGYWLFMAIYTALIEAGLNNIFPDKFMMNYGEPTKGVGQSLPGGSSSGTQGTSPSGIPHLQPGSSNKEIEALIKRVDALKLTNISHNLPFQVSNFYDLQRRFRELYNSHLISVDDLFSKYNQFHPKTENPEHLTKGIIAIHSKLNLLNSDNDKLGIKRLLLAKERFKLVSDFQMYTGSKIRDEILKAYKEKRVSAEYTQTFLRR